MAKVPISKVFFDIDGTLVDDAAEESGHRQAASVRRMPLILDVRLGFRRRTDAEPDRLEAALLVERARTAVGLKRM